MRVNHFIDRLVIDFGSRFIRLGDSSLVTTLSRGHRNTQQQPNWRPIVDYDNLSLEEIEQELQAIDQNRADLQKAREQLRQQAKYDLAQQIKDQITEHGYDLEEIVQLLETRKRRAAPKKGGRQYTR
jgi:predicted transcriptional regulator